MTSFAQICTWATAGASLTADVHGLRALHNSLQTSNENFPAAMQSWNFDDSSKYCQWFGVSCCPAPVDGQQAFHLKDLGLGLPCSDEGAVVAIELQNLNLGGEMPDWEDLSALQSLMLLNISFNTGVVSSP